MSSNTLKRSLDGSPEASDSNKLKLDAEDSQTVIPADGTEEDRQKGRKRRKNIGPKEGRRDRRGTRGTRKTEDVDEAASDASGEKEKKVRLPKRNCALLVGFCGTGCNGMQIFAGVVFKAHPNHHFNRQPNVRTIEGVLFNALVKAGAVSEDNADDPVKVGLARAARTDAGVHAAGNVVSIKMITVIPGVRNLLERINEELPPEIRLWSFQRTQNSFNAHVTCDSRMYTYFLPTYILIPPKPDSGFAQSLKTQNQELEFANDDDTHSFWKGVDLTQSPQEDLTRKRQWRVQTETLERLKNIISKYLGSHNFHNFTIGKEYSDRSNYRNMKKIEVQEPAVYNDTEWLPILFHGQSFMLHQRKMICVAVLACRTETPPAVIDAMYGPSKVVVPKAPALGLLLERPLFNTYNKKVKEANEKLTSPNDPAYRPIIDFDIHQDAIEQFKQDQIYSRMRAQESQEATFDSWIRSIDTYCGRDLLYFNKKGVIPSSIVLQKGERRPNPFREKKRFDATGPLTLGHVTADEEDDSEEENVDTSKLAEMEG